MSLTLLSGPATISIEWLLLIFAYGFVALRIWVYVKRKAISRVPEILLLAGLVMETAEIICDTMTFSWGGMRPAVQYANAPTGPSSVSLQKLAFASDSLFYLGIFFPKFCILTFYYKLIPSTSHRVRLALKCITVYLTCCFIATFFMIFASCTPISQNWSIDPNACHFTQGETMWIIHWTFDFSCDLAIFILPFFILYNLNLRKNQKYGVLGIFLLGLITIIISLVRFLYVQMLPAANTIYVWSAAEFCGSTIVVCLPSLKVVFRTFIGSSSGSSKPQSSTAAWPYSKTGPHKSQAGITSSARGGADRSEIELATQDGIMKTKSITITDTILVE